MIVLARHAHTKSAGRCIGRTEVPLTPKGRKQAASLAESLVGTGFVRLCSSPLARSMDTLTPLAQWLDMELTVVPGLVEIDMGAWEGLAFDVVRARFPEAYAERGRRFGSFRAPGGESFDDVADRALEALAELAAGPQPVFAVSHAGVIRAVLCRLTGHSMDDLFYFRPSYGACTILTSTRGRLTVAGTNIAPDGMLQFLRS